MQNKISNSMTIQERKSGLKQPKHKVFFFPQNNKKYNYIKQTIKETTYVRRMYCRQEKSKGHAAKSNDIPSTKLNLFKPG